MDSDARDRIVNDQPRDFLHRIASIVPGYEGYVDKERRRDADKMLRTQLARQFTDQREHLSRIQQNMARSHQTEYIAEVDRLAGVMQRFIDRLSTATYGYTGLFDPVKVEAQTLDQIYAFDMALASGADEASGAISEVESAAGNPPAMPDALSRLQSVLDDLHHRFNQRSDLITSGTRLPDPEFDSMMSSLDRKTSTYPGSTAESARVAGAPSQASSPTTSGAEAASGASAAPTIATGAGAGVGSLGGGTDSGGVATPPSEGGIPTTNLSMSGNTPATPGMTGMVEGNQGFAEMPEGGGMGDMGGAAPMPITNTGEVAPSPTAGIETASSPANQPGGPGGDIVEGLEMAPGAPSDLDATPTGDITPNVDRGMGGSADNTTR